MDYVVLFLHIYFVFFNNIHIQEIIKFLSTSDNGYSAIKYSLRLFSKDIALINTFTKIYTSIFLSPSTFIIKISFNCNFVFQQNSWHNCDLNPQDGGNISLYNLSYSF